MPLEECRPRAPFFSFFFFLLVIPSAAGSFVGFNIRRGPPTSAILSLLTRQNIRHVRLLDLDRPLLTALAGSHVEVMVTVPNYQVPLLGSSTSAAANWVKRHVAAFLPLTNITAVAVGDETLTRHPSSAGALVNAVKNVHLALVAADLSHVKVSSPQSMAVISQPFPPSTAVFDAKWRTYIRDLLEFLESTRSPFMLNASPYRGYVASGGVFPLEYALLEPLTDKIVDPNTLTGYESMFDAMVDAAVYAMAALNWTRIPVLVTETGWPWRGGRRAATVRNARAYTGNLIRHVLGGAAVKGAYVYELYSGGRAVEEWGVYSVNGTAEYDVDSVNRVFCVANSSVAAAALKAGLDWACGPGRVDCAAVRPGRACYGGGDIVWIATYVFNEYYHRTQAAGGSCDFGGAAYLTAADPSHGSCIFPGSSLEMVSLAMGPMAQTSEGSPTRRATAAAAGMVFLSLLVQLLRLLVH